MTSRDENSITAIVTDPPYGVKEYTKEELEKMKSGRGGIWRLPPCYDGHQRKALPRFSVINDDPKERENVYEFFNTWGTLAYRIVVPGAHVIIASTPLLSDIVSRAMRDAGFERRGEIIRVTKTLRGGDRPKGAEKEFEEMSVIPRGQWEPWGVFRKPIEETTVAKNLRKWDAGALRRPDVDSPFVDLYETGKTTSKEKEIAPHPSLKPQSFMRAIVHAALPTGKGVILDPFAGSGSTLAAAEYCGYDSIGIEIDDDFYDIGTEAIPKLAKI
ncbi:MAG: hypothetical protein LUE25_07960 [Clostridiales bacterium]|nr:hypothetical protein [Clostridiales bacterium]